MAKVLTCRKLLLVEGDHEKRSLTVLLNNLSLNNDCLTIEYVEGKENFAKAISALSLRSGFEKVELLAIFRDADENSNAAFQSLQAILSKNNFKCPPKPGEFVDGQPKVGIFILPQNDKDGMLEDLCLQTQAEHPVMKCVDEFFLCISNRKLNVPVNLSKAKAQVFLASMPRTIANIGIAAEKGYWNLEHDCLKDIKDFLEYLVQA